jgi:hypothetical protein
MTSSTTKIQPVTDGTTPNGGPPPREHGLAVLRSKESKSLISLAQDALSQTHDVGYQLHRAIHGYEPGTGDAPLERMLCEALACLETADHYLRMLGSVLDELTAQDGDPAGSGADR